MTIARDMGRVFISHSHRDDELVRDLARRLRGAGFKPIVDYGEPPVGTDRKKSTRARASAQRTRC